eukprot:365565-Rhodomonas_salina.1
MPDESQKSTEVPEPAKKTDLAVPKSALGARHQAASILFRRPEWPQKSQNSTTEYQMADEIPEKYQ